MAMDYVVSRLLLDMFCVTLRVLCVVHLPSLVMPSRMVQNLTYSKYVYIYILYSIFICLNLLNNNNSPNNIGNYLITHVELHLCLNLPIPSSRIRNRYNMPTSKLTSIYKTFYGNMSQKFSIHNANKSCHISSNDR